MKEYIGQIVLVSDNEENWVERELLAVLPEDIEYRYICRGTDIKSAASEYKYCKPKEVEPVYFYKYEYVNEGGKIIEETHFMTEDRALACGCTDENGFYKIESSKRTWEH